MVVVVGGSRVQANDPSGLQDSIIDAKGDLIAGTAADTPARVAVGTDGYLLKANSAAAPGVSWVSPAGIDTGAVPKSLVDAKGDILAGTADNTVARKAAGTNGYLLQADSSQSDGLAWVPRRAVIGFVIDGNGSAITTGIKGDIEVPFKSTIESARLFADQSGSIVIDLWKDTYTNFPPVVGDSITASAKPTLSSAAKSQDTTLTGWTLTVTAGDIIRVNVDSASTVTRVTLSLVLREIP